jgi:uncharacterized paraquat-inducible protein A
MFNGRYGMDSLNKGLLIAAGAFAALSLILTFTIGGYGFIGVAIALLLFALFRIFSRNTAARRNELIAWNMLKQKLKYKASARRDQYQQRKSYKYFKCPNCKQKLRVPRGKGKLQVTCSRCHTKFIKKS